MKINYNMTADYRNYWSAIDAVREIVQNALDLGSYTTDITSTSLVITTDATIPLQAFMLGYSDKSQHSIGRYGEGLKIAMLRLTALDLAPVLWFDNYMVVGSFEPCELTGLSTFSLQFHTVKTHQAGTRFMCLHEGIDLAELRYKLTPFDDNPLPCLRDDVRIIHNRPGDIYVNGIWVCNKPDLSYGYNFSPNRIQLNADRNMVDGVEYQLASYYNSQPRKADLIFQMLENDARDVAFLHIWLDSKKLKAELARLLFNKYGEGAKIGRPGTGYVGGYVSASNSAYQAYAKCGVPVAEKAIDADSPYGVLLAFQKQFNSKLRRDVRMALNTIVHSAKGWK